jgi:hypothetical protein
MALKWEIDGKVLATMSTKDLEKGISKDNKKRNAKIRKVLATRKNLTVPE